MTITPGLAGFVVGFVFALGFGIGYWRGGIYGADAAIKALRRLHQLGPP